MNTYYLVLASEYNDKEIHFLPLKKIDEVVENALTVTGSKTVQPADNFNQLTKEILSSRNLTEEQRAEELRDALNKYLNFRRTSRSTNAEDFEHLVQKVVSAVEKQAVSKQKRTPGTPGKAAPKPLIQKSLLPDLDVSLTDDDINSTPVTVVRNTKARTRNFADISKENVIASNEKRKRKPSNKFSPKSSLKFLKSVKRLDGSGWISHN